MTEEQKNAVVQLMQKEIDPSCYYDRGDFIIFRDRSNGFYRQMIIKEKSPWILLYGENYKTMRDLFAGGLANFATGEYIVDIPSESARGTKAVWCRIKFQYGRDWFAYRDRIIAVAKELRDKVVEWGVPENVSQVTIVDETTCPQFLSNASSKEQGSDDTTINQAVSAKEEEQGTGLMQPIRKESIDGLGLSASMSQYWQEYYDFWDRFVRNWFEEMRRRSNSLAQCHNPYGDENHISRVYARMVRGLNFNELPEPYIGTPHEGVEAVFLNLNPGMSMRGLYGRYRGKDLEATKFFSNLENETGWLICEFVKAGSYRNFINNWSCLKPDLRSHEPEVCGVDWWQGIDRDKIVDMGPRTGRQIRMPWVRQVYGNSAMSPLKVFAPELCPYHSPNFHANDILGDSRLVDFMWEHVMEPALVAVKENKKVPFVIAVGEDYCKLLKKFGAGEEKEWSLERTVDKWPPNRQRWYRLYTVDLDQHQKVRALVTWGGRNKAPSNVFDKIETKIRTYCKDNPL